MANSKNPFLLIADNKISELLDLLRADSSIASRQDETGYSLLHAAASYGHVELLKQLVGEFGVDVNLKDGDGETALFVAERVDVAKTLVEDLGLDVAVKSESDGLTATEWVRTEQEFPEVVEYLSRRTSGSDGQSEQHAVHAPPPLPPDVRLNILGPMEQSQSDGTHGDGEEVVDPDFKRRIDELASREDFQGEEGQKELRNLITEAVREHLSGGSTSDAGHSSNKRRIG